MTEGAEKGARWIGKIIRDEIAKKAFWAIVALAALVITAVIRRGDLHFTKLELALCALLLLSYATWAGYEMYRRRSYKRPHYPRVRFHYEVLSKTIEYRIDDDGCVHFSRRVKLKALVDHVDNYIDKFVWTGGESALPIPGEGADSVSRLLRAGIWTFYTTNLPYALRKGAIHELVVHWPPLANWRGSQPFVSTSTEEPTREIKFIVQVPESLLGSPSFLAEELRGIESAYPFQTLSMTSDRGRIEWKFKPKVYRHYRLRWSWANGEVLTNMPTPRVEEASGS